MKIDLSPGAERVVERARLLAAQANRSEPLAFDLLQALLEDEWSSASELVTRFGPGRDDLLARLDSTLALERSSLHDIVLRTRGLALRHGSDSTITGEFLFAALLDVDVAIREHLNTIGIDCVAISEAILGKVGEPIPLETSVRLADPVDELAAGRVLDVNANRVRESLRILDDYCRFVLNDALLTREVKALRHAFVAAFGEVRDDLLLSSRDTLADVGTVIEQGGEYFRRSPRHLAAVNLKRLQESLRSLEEYSKILSEQLPRALEQFRYRAYTLEKMILTGTDARERLLRVQLYLLIGSGQGEASLEWIVSEAIRGGVQMVQFREKNRTDREILDRARRLRTLTREHGVLLILNDRPDLARLAEADGVHLGQDDLSLFEARKIVGPEMLIGVSTHDLDQVRAAVREGANYLGVGPTFPSQTKQFEQFAGLQFIQAVSEETTLPWFAIGGINSTTLPKAMKSGARRVAVSAAIAAQAEPAFAASELRQQLDFFPDQAAKAERTE